MRRTSISIVALWLSATVVIAGSKPVEVFIPEFVLCQVSDPTGPREKIALCTVVDDGNPFSTAGRSGEMGTLDSKSGLGIRRVTGGSDDILLRYHDPRDVRALLTWLLGVFLP
jgi:hypothetical protein